MTDRRLVLAAVLRTDFISFLHKAFDTLCEGAEFKPNWHLEAIAHALEPAEAGLGARVIVNVPPRSLKSISISVAWVAWRLGHDPSLRFLCVSYSAELSTKHARDCRTLMQTDWYRDLFPRTVLSRIAEHDFDTTARGGRMSTSVGGTLTGRGGDIIIIDDPIKPDEAATEIARRNVIDWYAASLASRLDDKTKGSIVLVMQRVHENDLAGHLLEAGGWTHLNLPAIAEVGEDIPLGRGRVHQRRAGDLLHPLRETRQVLDGLKATMGSSVFSAQYQQAPVPVGGNLIERVWLQYVPRPPSRAPGDIVVQSWDCASKDGALNDYSVCLTVLIRGRSIYVLDVYRQKLKFPDLVKAALRLAEDYRADLILIEDAASGTQLIQTLRHSNQNNIATPIARRPDGDKVSRMAGASHRIEAGNLILPQNAPWLAEFERELLAFPNGRHDDQVDALAQLLNWNRIPEHHSLPGEAYEISASDGIGLDDDWDDEPDDLDSCLY